MIAQIMDAVIAASTPGVMCRSELEARKSLALSDAAAVTRCITNMALACHKLALLSGWHSRTLNLDPQSLEYRDKLGCMVALEHSELSESLEGIRKDSMDSHLPHRKTEEVEAADAIIRIFDRMALRGYDIGGAIYEKLVYNASREDHKPEARAAAGGKKF